MSVMIIIICGLPGVGKTTVAKGLAPISKRCCSSNGQNKERAIFQANVLDRGKED